VHRFVATPSPRVLMATDDQLPSRSPSTRIGIVAGGRDAAGDSGVPSG
jgi:hypothetical protein